MSFTMKLTIRALNDSIEHLTARSGSTPGVEQRCLIGVGHLLEGLEVRTSHFVLYVTVSYGVFNSWGLRRKWDKSWCEEGGGRDRIN